MARTVPKDCASRKKCVPQADLAMDDRFRVIPWSTTSVKWRFAGLVNHVKLGWGTFVKAIDLYV